MTDFQELTGKEKVAEVKWPACQSLETSLLFLRKLCNKPDLQSADKDRETPSTDAEDKHKVVKKISCVVT